MEQDGVSKKPERNPCIPGSVQPERDCEAVRAFQAASFQIRDKQAIKTSPGR
jgi:hypothetical protein